jgi:hypothetical protein
MSIIIHSAGQYELGPHLPNIPLYSLLLVHAFVTAIHSSGSARSSWSG